MWASFKFNPYCLLLAAWACTSAMADNTDNVGNWWIVYHQGVMQKNVVYVADQMSVKTSSKDKSIQTVEVSQVHAGTSAPRADIYIVEVQCSKHRARFVDGTSQELPSNKRRPLEVSGEWQTLDDRALLYTFGFVCNPRDRSINGMTELGKLTRTKVLAIIVENYSPPKSPMEELDQLLGNQ